MGNLDKLLAQREEIENRIKVARQRSKSQQRKQDTRRKVILGAYLLERMGRDPKLRTDTLRDLKGYLTRPVDLELFESLTFTTGDGPSETPSSPTPTRSSAPRRAAGLKRSSKPKGSPSAGPSSSDTLPEAEANMAGTPDAVPQIPKGVLAVAHRDEMKGTFVPRPDSKEI